MEVFVTAYLASSHLSDSETRTKSLLLSTSFKASVGLNVMVMGAGNSLPSFEAGQGA